MAINDPIYDEALKSAQGFYDLNRQKGIEDVQRAGVVQRRRSYSTPQDITNFSQQYDMTTNRDLSQMALGQQDKRAAEVNQWGGISPYTGATIQGQLPYQSQQNEIQRSWSRKLQEDQWNAQQQVANQQASNTLWGMIGGGIGTILGGPLGGGIANAIFGGGKKAGEVGYNGGWQSQMKYTNTYGEIPTYGTSKIDLDNPYKENW